MTRIYFDKLAVRSELPLGRAEVLLTILKIVITHDPKYPCIFYLPPRANTCLGAKLHVSLGDENKNVHEELMGIFGVIKNAIKDISRLPSRPHNSSERDS